MASQTLLIEQLRRGRCDKKIHVRVSRIWKAYNTKKTRDLISMDLLAIDEKAIHSCIQSKFVPDFEGLFTEGSFYSVKNFTVELTKPLYRVVHRELFILLNVSTFVEEIVKNPPKIPRHVFNIVPYDLLLPTGDDQKNLCDVIGYVVGASEVGERISNFQKVSMQYIDFRDARSNKFRLTLWGNEIIGMARTLLELDQRAWIVCAAIVKAESNGSVAISTSSATRFYDDTTLPEIQQFLELLGPVPQDEEIDNIPMYPSFISKEEYDKNKMLIRDINGLLLQSEIMKMPIYVYASVSTIEEVNGWKYNSCCNKKIQFLNGKPYCSECKKDEISPIISYRVEAELHDGTDSLKCFLFDREVEKLINFKAQDLAQIVDEEGNMEPIPRQLRQIIGKCHVFQLLFNEQSRGTMHENFAVKRVLFETDIRDSAKEKECENVTEENMTGRDVSMISVKTPHVQEKRKALRIGSNEAASGQFDVGEAEEVEKGKASTISRKAKRGIDFK